MRRILRIWPLYFLVFYGLAVLVQFVPWAGVRDPAAWLAFTLLRVTGGSVRMGGYRRFR
jgi:hypothetical protein